MCTMRQTSLASFCSLVCELFSDKTLKFCFRAEMAVGRVDQYQRTGVAWEVWAWGNTQDNFRESRCHAMFDPTICFFRFLCPKC